MKYRSKKNNPIYCPDTGETCPDYENYLQSRHWNNLRMNYYRLKGKSCFVCNQPGIHIHHTSYSRIGQELFHDIIGLCPDCHIGVHKLIKEGVRGLDAHIVLAAHKQKADPREKAFMYEGIDLMPRKKPDSSEMKIINASPALSFMHRAANAHRKLSKKAIAIHYGLDPNPENHGDNCS